VLVSRDQGCRWTMTDVPDSVGAVHMNIVSLGGARMVAFYRNRFARQVLRSVSVDSGLTWTRPEPTELPNNNSSIQATRLSGGQIAMVYNHSNASMSGERRLSLYDEIEPEGEAGDCEPVPSLEMSENKGTGAVWGVPRAPLSLVISSDGGQSFSDRQDLDIGDGYCLTNNSRDALNREYSYPSIIEGPDGGLHVAYTYYRRAIKYVRLSPQG